MFDSKSPKYQIGPAVCLKAVEIRMLKKWICHSECQMGYKKSIGRSHGLATKAVDPLRQANGCLSNPAGMRQAQPRSAHAAGCLLAVTSEANVLQDYHTPGMSSLVPAFVSLWKTYTIAVLGPDLRGCQSKQASTPDLQLRPRPALHVVHSPNRTFLWPQWRHTIRI